MVHCVQMVRSRSYQIANTSDAAKPNLIIGVTVTARKQWSAIAKTLY